ncbi:MAG: isoleucine--tRNA ligase [Candidatus Margulisbacteria bacterium GWF2_35_9]|nr:MAG: isoleucine--tRNA ligase [Candidatus Margulisbacteria bacterium GWF2_35_9]
MENNKLDFIENEHEILSLWKDNYLFEKLTEKNKNGKPFRFLDGPMTANNAMGIHHAWGRSIKDIFLRYKAMNGYSCHYRNGFDTQGLWVEVEVEKELGFKDKKDIESYGMDNFTKRCVERIKKFSKIITEQSKRLGQWMDWENSYFTHTDENITAIWYFLKTCNENGWIARSHRPMPWCPRCGTSLSEHEMTGSHKDITHTAVFAKLPVHDRNFDILVWTTTPWTLSANVALAVNPNLDYVIAEVDNCKRPLVLAKSALGVISGEKKVLKIIKGEELVGLSYETFFPFLSVQTNLQHKIVEWSEVEANEGSGVVHIAPGCGAEDFDLGKVLNLSQICPIDESGHFTNEYDFLSSRSASEVAPLVFEKLKQQDKLYKTHEYIHSYPVCWRCKTEVLFRLIQSWTIKTDEIRPKLLSEASNVKWEPSFAGKRMQDWLTNMGDWNISRKRFYGLPLPFYPCAKCGNLTVIGSKEELRKLGGEKVDSLPELHRPWIDEIKISCPVCGELVERVPEVGDVWLDAGITPFSTLGYFTDRNAWEKQFPLELVLEMNEQIRLWFYSLLFMSITLTGKAPYERVMTHGSVVQEDGSRFHKSGFMIKFDEAAEKIGSDAIRYLYAGANISSDVRFGYNLGDEARRKLLGFWNIYTFFMTYANIDNPTFIGLNSDNLMDVWLINRINEFVSKAAKAYESYDTSEIVREFEVCVNDVSNWYVRACRKRFWNDRLDNDKQNAYNFLLYALKIMCQIMAPIIPFMTERIWQTTVRKYSTAEESVHLSDFPQTLPVNSSVLNDVKTVREVIAGAMKLRNESGLKVKQPLPVLYIDAALQQVCSKFQDVIKDELNVKEIVYLEDFTMLCEEYILLNFKTAGRVLKGDLNKVKEHISTLPADAIKEVISFLKSCKKISVCGYELDNDLLSIEQKDKPHIKRSADGIRLAINTEITLELKEEGCYREILRHCQVLRKEAGLDVADRAKINFITDDLYIQAIIEKYKDCLEHETLATIEIINENNFSKTINVNNAIIKIIISK